MSVGERVAQVTEAHAAVLAHPMCLRLEDAGGHYLVVFPVGDFPVHGVRVSKGMGKAKALNTMLDRIERIWLESYP